MKKISKLMLLLFMLISVGVNAMNYYVDYATGNDANTGMAIGSPLKTIEAAVTIVNPGDIIFIRGGVQTCPNRIILAKSGTETKRIFMMAYPGDARPILTFDGVDGDNKQGIQIGGNYWYLSGFDVTKAGDNGILVQAGAYNILNDIKVYDTQDAGVQIKGGGHDNKFINCDSYGNADPGATSYGNADGFAPKMDVGSNNYFFGCRAWNNCDDGWDGYIKDAVEMTTILENCWTWKSGYLIDNSNPGGSSNGNGFKTGGGDAGAGGDPSHNTVMLNCLSFANKAKGFDQNGNTGSITAINCTAIGNLAGGDFVFKTALAPGKTLTFQNCVSSGASAAKVGDLLLTASVSNCSFKPKGGTSTNILNSFTPKFKSVNVTEGHTQCSAPRQADGALPELTTFAQINADAAMIDKGMVITTPKALPYNGTAPDMGCFETGASTSVKYSVTANAVGGGSIQLIPALASYTKGSYVTVIAVPDASKKFDSWSGDLTGKTTVREILIDGNKSITANFSDLGTVYKLNVTNVGSGKVSFNPASVDGYYPVGTEVIMSAMSVAGNVFSGYSGDLTTTCKDVLIVMNSDKNITATYSVSTATVLQVESATGLAMSSGTAKERTNPGFTGTDYINFANSISSYFSFTLNVATAGNYNIYVYYASTEDRPLAISANGVAGTPNPVACPPSGNFNTYVYSTVVVALNAGNNTIKIASTVANGGPNVDKIAYEKLAGTAENCPVPAFTPDVSEIKSVVSQIKSMEVAPTIVDNETVLSFNIEKTAPVEIQVVSVNGNVVKSFDSVYSFGQNYKIMNLSDLNSGIYFVKMNVNGNVKVVKIFKK